MIRPGNTLLLEDRNALAMYRAVHSDWPRATGRRRLHGRRRTKPSRTPNARPTGLAIDKLTREMIQAFDQRDAAAIAAHWTEEGEFIRNDGEPIRGRAEIQKGYAEFFKTLKGKPKLEIQSDAVRFPSADTAVTEVTLRLRNDDGEIVASGRQDTVLVREGGQWKMAIRPRMGSRHRPGREPQRPRMAHRDLAGGHQGTGGDHHLRVGRDTRRSFAANSRSRKAARSSSRGRR